MKSVKFRRVENERQTVPRPRHPGTFKLGSFMRRQGTVAVIPTQNPEFIVLEKFEGMD